ncbi:hypothetical protein ORI20_24140 [Mycobacterium sp. CVI_P3]|uniref:Uncharacterized protein n=1 Tax=Mycobacterium pinniadriaticum TaxID=2994102 RepID=A0ABT3SLP1_9MYCO|nr:hypothetical protein [Mycobacterium pinniadriaticum]MCX2933368.1 hypothetical protein [Mycobacterium pinniadriaticum]MCX2939790.1 hypothetical protein [Mycobacterium pinniadriaticum]
MTSKANIRRRGVPAAPYVNLSEIILRFTDAVDTLLAVDFEFPFSIGSEGLRDCAADELHRGTLTTQAVTRMATMQLYAVAAQCDLHRGMAAALRADGVFFSPYPLARTCVVTAAKAWLIISAPTREDRLQRYLNEELVALYGAPWEFTDPDSTPDIAAKTDDLAAVGATAGLRLLPKKKTARNSRAPHLVRADQEDGARPPSESRIVRDVFESSGLGADQVDKPYTLLSAATHGRFIQSGVSESIPAGRSRFDVPTRGLSSSPGTTAKVTVLAAIATRTHLRALARYTNVPQEQVQDRLGAPFREWCAAGGVEPPA